MLDKFDPNRSAVINPNLNGIRSVVDCCVINFSSAIEKIVDNLEDSYIIDELRSVTGNKNIYLIKYRDIKVAFYTSTVGAPASVGLFETSRELLDTKVFISFGTCGCLKTDIKANTIIIPTESYRDEGTSYHYLDDSDYIRHDNYAVVKKFFQRNDIPCVSGKNWTTDAIFRETRDNMFKHKKDGCISVDMELSALQAVSDYRGTSLYSFLVGADLLKNNGYDRRLKERININKVLLDYVLGLCFHIVNHGGV